MVSGRNPHFPVRLRASWKSLNATKLTATGFGGIVASLGVLVCAFSIEQAAAQNEGDWEFIIAPYGLAANMTGDAALGRLEAPVDIAFGDILKSLEFGFMIHAEARKGRFGIITDFSYMKLGDKISSAVGIIADVEAEEALWETFLSYRLGGAREGLDLLAGIRYWNIDLDLTLTGGPLDVSFKRTEEWVDPVIGARYIFRLGSRWRANLQIDVGGFGISSDFTWNVLGGVIYEYSDSFEIALQYRYLDVDYDRGTPGTPDFFKYDVATHGPLLGAIFRF